MKVSLSKKELLVLTLIFIMISISIFSITSIAAKPDKISPTAPTNLKMVSVTGMSISLAWDPSKDNVGVKSYSIYKDNVHIGDSTGTTYTVNGLTAGKSYSFYVKAKDAAGNFSNPSNTLTATTAQITTAPTPEPTPTPTPTPTPPPAESKTTKIVGYYAAWSAYSGFTPDKIDASKLTHINYAFANIGSDLRITLGYPDVDLANFSKLNALKQNHPGLKTLIAVGGWSWSGKFSDAALTDVSRTAFADSCVEFMVKYGFDGVDMDWEYPVSGGMATNVKRPEDKQNFTQLLKKLREKLDARGSLDGKHYLLTMAGAAANGYVYTTELNILHQYLDYGNIMAYDIHGTWDRYTDFNAPLKNNTDSTLQVQWSVGTSVNAWLQAGFPTEKIVVGIPFYGYKYNAVNNANNGLYQAHSGGSAITYANIVANFLHAPGYTRYFYQQSLVPWLFNGSTFISYEDEQSIGLKAGYIKSKGVGGAMIWELSQDSKGVLLNSLYQALQR